MKSGNRNSAGFSERHIGTSGHEDLQQMLAVLKAESLDQLITETIPDDIRLNRSLNIPDALTEQEYLRHIKSLADQNLVYRSYIGLGYYSCHTPSVIRRSIFENPGWYTQYTPYQAEISQGRLEALLNFQTMVSDLTGLPVANASLLDEGTAAAEAMTMLYNLSSKKTKGTAPTHFFVDKNIFPQTLAVLRSRATPIGINLVLGDWQTWNGGDEFFGALLQYPNARGSVEDYSSKVMQWHSENIKVAVISDLLALTLLTSPGQWGADVVVGNSQRFGVPVGFGGPHAAFFATKEEYKRNIPGRIIGVSVDRHGHRALRMALQTREQHIKREKATSNICTAQALLAIMAGMYAVYHGPVTLRQIALDVHAKTVTLYKHLNAIGLTPAHDVFFDTLSIPVNEEFLSLIRSEAEKKKINFYYTKDEIRISLDETVLDQDLYDICSVFSAAMRMNGTSVIEVTSDMMIPGGLQRKDEILTHPVFNTYHTETELMRYIKSLENKDLSLVHAMIPLGSCTMKLNAATEMYPVSWPEFSSLHPFVPGEQAKGYYKVFENLGAYLSEITGMKSCSLQPNSGAQGELTGLLTIRAYHEARGDQHRNIALIPQSAHGTNPASAVMAGMEVVVVKCDDRGNIDMTDLLAQAQKHKDNLACVMVTYPSTHGVFEKPIRELCKIIHDHGGLVYLDGANMNAQVGLTSPGHIGADVCHLNLHKTFAIPHGGGGPGMGPICVNEKLAPYLPGHPLNQVGGSDAIDAVSSAPWGSASVLLISYGYIRLLGAQGLKDSTVHAILNSNYIKSRLENHYEILYTGDLGRTAHELIIDLRPFKQYGVSAEDVAKRLIDYGFHAPTLSFPVPGTIMIEPTESESKAELDLFCDALIQIHKEIDEIASGKKPADNNVLVNAPHTLGVITADEWSLPYSRSEAAYPIAELRHRHKFWPAVGRVDNAYGDRNLVCVCPPIEAYASPEAVEA